MRLQSNIAKTVQSPGNLPFEKYRAYHSLVREASEPFRFVDGELMEMFLGCEAEVQLRIVEGLGVGVGEVRGVVENLRRMH